MPTLYAGFDDELLRIDGHKDGDVTAPTATTVFDGHEIECVSAPPETTNVLCGTFEHGVHRSTDRGESWTRVGADTIGEDAVMSIAVDPTDPSTIWLGTEPSAVYRSTDGGATWEEKPGLTDLPSASNWSFPPRPDTHHVRWIEVDPADPDHLYVGIEAGALVQTHDAGETWEDRVPSSRRDNHSLATHPDAPGRAWSAAGDGFAETRDGGETWDHPQQGLDHRYCWSVTTDPADPETVLLSSAHGPRSAHSPSTAESYVYRRVGDSDWERAGNGLPTGEGFLRPVLARGTEPGEVYAATNLGIYRMTDAGETWRSLELDWPDHLERQTPTGLAVR